MSSAVDSVADGAARERAAEEMDAFLQGARTQERELKDLLEQEIATASVADKKVTDQWRSILRLAKVRR
jgi:hypothetical protein